MDGLKFDRLTRTLSSRRTALGGLLAGLLLPIEASARKKGKRRKGKEKNRQRVRAQDTCWRAGACIPKKGANVSQCDLANYRPTATLDCTGCNISRANLRGANLSGANLTRANLSGSCLVDANLSGATVTNTTNLYNAIFCRTTMPDGSINNSGCGSGTACCSTCVPTTCSALGKTCGSWPDGCGGMLQCGSCPNRQICVAGSSCQPCDVCASGCPFTTVQAAINAGNPQLITIRVCPGAYIENSLPWEAVTIDRPLTLIGAGDGADPTTSTILRPALTDQDVVSVNNAGTVRLEGVRITGARGLSLGLRAQDTTLALVNATITEITVPAFGGAFSMSGQVTLINTRVVKNSGDFVGGIYVFGGSLTLDALSRVTDNVATDPTFGVGGIRSDSFPVTVPSVENVTGNRPINCWGSAFSGPGAVCTST